MTGAGATFPYGKDPKDSNILYRSDIPRLLTSFARPWRYSVFAVKLASVEVLLNK